MGSELKSALGELWSPLGALTISYFRCIFVRTMGGVHIWGGRRGENVTTEDPERSFAVLQEGPRTRVLFPSVCATFVVLF